MSDVTVIGLGSMGSALARAFLSAGKKLTVWNRSSARAESLKQMGATRASTIAAAVSASPVVVICLSDYAATDSALNSEDLAHMLPGRLIVQLSSGTPNQARALESWTTARGAHYLDGAIAAWPRQIGGPDATIVVAGPAAQFESAEPLLKLLAGNVTHAGANIGHAMALFNAALAYYAGHWIGFSHGAAICEGEGIGADTFGEVMASMSSSFGDDMRHMGRVIANNDYGNPESTIKTVSADIARLVELSRDLNIGAAFPTFAADIFRRTLDAGFGPEEHCAVIKVLRTA